MRFAEQRAADWDALRPCVVLEATVGSRAWGLADEGSDTDLRGVFALPFSWTSGLVDPPHALASADGSATYWEHRKAIHQALRADPNTLELLFVPTARAVDPIGEWLLEARDAFVSADLFGSFGRYAVSQLGKLVPVGAARRAPRARARLAQGGARARARRGRRAARGDLAPPGAALRRTALLAAKEYVKQLYRSLFDQGLLDANDFAALVRFARGGGKQPEPARELRPKNAYNLLRLIHVATGWLRTGRPELEMKGAVRERLLEIKRAPSISTRCSRRRSGSFRRSRPRATRRTLPKRPDVARADALLRGSARRSPGAGSRGTPGPFGADAPPPPRAPRGVHVTDVLDPQQQRAVAERVLAEESAARRHLVVALSGAPRLRLPLARQRPRPEGDPRRPDGAAPRPIASAANAPERIEVMDVEIDYSSNELQPVLVGILQGNGNFIERVLSRIVLRSSPEHESLRRSSRGASRGGSTATTAASPRASSASGRRTASAPRRSSSTCSGPR